MENGKAGGAALAWLLILFLMAASVCGIAGNGDLMASEMLKHAPPERTGLPEAEYEPVGRMMADFLCGREDTFQHTFSGGDGTIYQCFQPHEAAHMADCRSLIRLAESIRLASGTAGALLLLAGIMIPKARKRFASGAVVGLRSAGLIGAVLLLWGLIDFDGLFTAFHRIAFTNDGWLLDPRTDLLIRLMPEELFTALAARVLLQICAGAAAAGAAAEWIVRRQRKKESPEEV